MEAWEFAIAYHEETKHHYRRYARSPGYLDWANQPDPFRRYAGCEVLALAHGAADRGPAYAELFVPGLIPSTAVNRESISALFEYALALSAWKEFRGTRWALRINPSSGNLHPTEGYLISGAVPGLIERAGVLHYAPQAHALERRATISDESWRKLIDGFPPHSFLIALTSIHWREAWKYGERAYRYCQHDAGHALAAIALSAAVHGWRLHPLSDWGDDEIAALLGLSRDGDYGDAEREAPDLLVAVIPEADGSDLPARWRHDVNTDAGAFVWQGRANRLSTEHVAWELIDAVADACRKPVTLDLRSIGAESRIDVPASVPREISSHQRDMPLKVRRAVAWDGTSKERADQPGAGEAVPARQIIRQRRSAVAMDGHTSISADAFFAMMDRVMPRLDRAPWNALGLPVCVHLALFVHRVEDVSPGLYFLVRDMAKKEELQAAMNAAWEWETPEGCPAGVPLFRLGRGDYTTLATRVSCAQDIAGDGVFSCGMIAEFERPLREYGGWFYRRLFWETGVIGQVLYLEAEAAGVRATGIGCFFDDPVHEVFGLTGKTWQSLYHFTVGGPVEDTRLTTLPAYPSGATD